MICIIAGNYDEAKTWASGQHLAKDEWFFPTELSDLNSRENFHVVVVGTAGWNVSPGYFEKVFSLAQVRGRINRH